MPYKDKERAKQYNKEYLKTYVRKNVQQYDRDYYAKHKDRIKARLDAYTPEHKAIIAQKCQIRNKRRNWQYKLEALSHYGNKCNYCGETNPLFLTLDHVNNDGAKHRKEIGKCIYIWLRKNNYPKENFQILCFNCNCAKEYYGYGPQKEAYNDLLVYNSI